ncbi:serine/threonine-protein kinase [Ideonella alba]|uniref:Protein kinase n=1 Tax=Ideonella alba TaxID=2824118 RepID=A0A941BDJ8_9BURK|nr:serine/threonine-protein kinase [Ideonella alba]MBQ0928997.1 protein kinase [Ideonella alba]
MSDDADPAAQAARARWQRVSAWLDEALDREDPAERAAWRAALQGPADALDELDALLAAHERAQTHPALQAPPPLGERPPARASRQPGERIGPWALQALLGTGGMAEVWSACRADGAYERQVALKLPLHLPWRDDLAERLARERDLLARLDHPHIARLYDAGLDGQKPWLAMEHVQGAPLTTWCDERTRSPRGRVRIFLQVLDAVAHAHAQLVLHRDLKPGNILVDQQGQVKLLDFGIAKLLGDDDRTHDTQLTALGGRALTPDYASPEQLRGEPLSTASDVYALGVILHELLCGELPYRLRHRSAAQLETAVLQGDTTRPSARVAAGAAGRRGLTARRLAQALRGDLDAIVLQALRTDPAQRYAGATELRADLQRWLDGQPVLAQPDSWLYRSRVFVRRHRLAVAAGGVVALALVASSVFSWQQARLAQREALRAQATRDFVLDLYKPVSWLNANPRRGGQVTARELLDLSAQQLLRQPVADPGVQFDLLLALLHLYEDVGSAPGRLQMATALEELARQRLGAASPQRFRSLTLLAEVLFESDSAAAQTRLQQAQALLDQVPLDDALRMHYWLVRGQVDEESHADQAEQALEQAVALSNAPGTLPMQRAQALMLLARVRWDAKGRLDDAVSLYEQALAIMRATPSIQPFAYTQPEVELAEVQMMRGHIDEAGRLLQTAFRRGEDGLGLRHPDTTQTGLRLAGWHRRVGQPQAALVLLRSLLQAWDGDSAASDDLLTVPNLHRQLVETYTAMGRWPDALTHSERALAGLERRYGQAPLVTHAVWLLERAIAQAGAGDARGAQATLARARQEGARIAATPAYRRKLAAAEALVATLALATEPARRPAALAALDQWETVAVAMEERGGEIPRQRARASVAVWRAQAQAFAGDWVAAETAADAALALLTPPVRAQIGALEWHDARWLRAEALWRSGRAAEACQAVSTPEDRTAAAAPMGSTADLAARLALACGAGAAGVAPVGESPWAARVRAIGGLSAR